MAAGGVSQLRRNNSVGATVHLPKQSDDRSEELIQ